MDHRLSRFKHRHNKRYKPMTESERRYFQKRYGMTPEEYYRRKHIDDTSLPDPTHGEFKMPQSRSNSRYLRREHEDSSSQIHTSRGFGNRRSSLDPPSLQRNSYGSHDGSSSLDPPSLSRASLDPPSLSRASLDPPSFPNEPSLQFSSMSISGDDDFDPSTTNIPSFGNTLNFNPSTGKASQAENDIIESMKNINFDDI